MSLHTLPPFVRTSATSREAALSVYFKTGTQKDAILAALRTLGPLSDEGIADATHLSLNTVRPRRGELRDDELIRPAGFGKTHAGNRCQLWEITPAEPEQGAFSL